MYLAPALTLTLFQIGLGKYCCTQKWGNHSVATQPDNIHYDNFVIRTLQTALMKEFVHYLGVLQKRNHQIKYEYNIFRGVMLMVDV